MCTCNGTACFKEQPLREHGSRTCYTRVCQCVRVMCVLNANVHVSLCVQCRSPNGRCNTGTHLPLPCPDCQEECDWECGAHHSGNQTLGEHLHSVLYTVNTVLYSVVYTVNTVLYSVVCTVNTVLYSVVYTVNTVLYSVVYTVNTVLYSVVFTVNTVLYSVVYTVNTVLYSVVYTVNTVLYSVLYTVNTVLYSVLYLLSKQHIHMYEFSTSDSEMRLNEKCLYGCLHTQYARVCIGVCVSMCVYDWNAFILQAVTQR